MTTDSKDSLYFQLKLDEGVVYEVYKDHLGYLTFGVGHLITKNDLEYGASVGTPVSSERVREAFEKDLQTCINECIVLYGENTWYGFPEEVKEILANMMFNMGRPRLSKFKKMKLALSSGDWSKAALEGRDSLWYLQVTNRAERLMKRLEGV